MQKFVGGNRSLDAKERFPPSEKAIKELIDTDLPFPMLYGGKRKGLIAIPTRFCIEPKFLRILVTVQSTMEPKEDEEPLRPLRGHLP